jgi:hypothetical protein
MTAEQRRCLLFGLAERLAAGGEEYSEPAGWFGELRRMPLDLVAGDVLLLAVMAEPGAGRGGYRPFKFVVRMVGALLAEGALGAETRASGHGFARHLPD